MGPRLSTLKFFFAPLSNRSLTISNRTSKSTCPSRRSSELTLILFSSFLRSNFTDGDFKICVLQFVSNDKLRRIAVKNLEPGTGQIVCDYKKQFIHVRTPSLLGVGIGLKSLAVRDRLIDFTGHSHFRPI